MSSRASVNNELPSPYIEKKGRLYRIKRKLTYAFAFRLLNKYFSRFQYLEILEIGTGSGFFLEFAKEFFPNSHLSGVEYDERLLTETALRAPHARLIQGNAEDFIFEKGHYDLVVSFQVIEHLYNPSSMLENVRAYLKPGGVFLVTTPNLTGLGAKVMKERWHGYRYYHISLKGMDEWKRLIVDHGFISLYSGSTFFSGIPLLNHPPLGMINWLLLLSFGSLRWSLGESFVGVFKSPL